MSDKSSLLNELRIARDTQPSQERGRAKWPIVVVLALSLAAAGAWYFRAHLVDFSHATTVKVAEVSTTEPGAAGGAGLLEASGYVVTDRQSTVASKITDRVVQILVREGDRVEAGQVIARLDDSNTRAALNLADAQFRAAKLVFADAIPIYDRSKNLLAAGVSTQQALDTAKSTYDVARTNMNVAQNVREVAQRAQDDTIIRAPFAGIVTDIAAHEGEIVSPISAGGGFTRTGLCTIVDMNSLEVEVEVNEEYINRVHVGQPAAIHLDAYPDLSLSGTVAAVIPTADQAKGTVRVRVDFADKDPRILPHMSVRVTLLDNAGTSARGGVSRPALTIPARAVLREQDGRTYAFVVHDEKAEKRAVRVARRQGDDVTVLSGLDGGERVVVGDLSGLTDGARVAVEP